MLKEFRGLHPNGLGYFLLRVRDYVCENKDGYCGIDDHIDQLARRLELYTPQDQGVSAPPNADSPVGQPYTQEVDKGHRSATECAPGPDFRSVKWYGATYAFTPNQAACVKVLWEAWDRGTPDVGDATLLEAADQSTDQCVSREFKQPRLRDVFKNRGGKMHAAWGTMIGEGATKGTCRLRPPDESPQ